MSKHVSLQKFALCQHVTRFNFSHYSMMDELARTGKLKNPMSEKEEKGRKVAETMMLVGFDKKAVWPMKTICQVPSQT